jgi:hypothetical protein
MPAQSEVRGLLKGDFDAQILTWASSWFDLHFLTDKADARVSPIE